jgi:hypothetical protein
LQDRAYFAPSQQGDEAKLRAWIDARRTDAPRLYDDAPLAPASAGDDVEL